jgi:preprotein translocase subunit YajC
MSTQALIQLMPLVLLIFIMYFLLIRPQKKREKTINQMRNSLKVGDEIITIGGICAKIIKLKDDKLTIEVGSDKTKFEIMRWAVSKTLSNEPVKELVAKPSKGKKADKNKEPQAEAEPVQEEAPAQDDTDK